MNLSDEDRKIFFVVGCICAVASIALALVPFVIRPKRELLHTYRHTCGCVWQMWDIAVQLNGPPNFCPGCRESLRIGPQKIDATS